MGKAEGVSRWTASPNITGRRKIAATKSHLPAACEASRAIHHMRRFSLMHEQETLLLSVQPFFQPVIHLFSDLFRDSFRLNRIQLHRPGNGKQFLFPGIFPVSVNRCRVLTSNGAAVCQIIRRSQLPPSLFFIIKKRKILGVVIPVMRIDIKAHKAVHLFQLTVIIRQFQGKPHQNMIIQIRDPM